MDFDNTIFKNSKAEDFLNITHSKFKIEKSSFMNCVSDALDSDFSNGRIISSEFSNIDGDAVDFSGKYNYEYAVNLTANYQSSYPST